MSEEQAVAVESAASPEVQAQAEKMGWIPPTRFRGDPERFVDADVFIEKGETVLPIVKKQNQLLRQELEATKAQANANAAALAKATKAIEEIEERHTVATQKAVAAARQEVKTQLAKASEVGDHEAVAELTDQLTQLNVAETGKEEKKTETTTVAAPFVPPPALAAWTEENPWFGKDKRKTALALGIAQELREAGEKSQGAEFFELVSAEMDKTLGTREVERPVDKVEGARNGSEGGRSGGKKGYANLPADAKAACKQDARNFVGPGKRYKTEAEWNTRYAELYFEGS